MVFVEVGSPNILAGGQTVFSCRSVWQIFMPSMQCYHCLHASGRCAVNFWNLVLVIFALECPFQGEENNYAWSWLKEILTKQQNFFWQA